MVFNSYEFIVIFLPLAFAAFALAHRIGGWNAAYMMLGVISLAFYAQLGLELLGILLISIVSNYVIGNIIIRARENASMSFMLLILAVLGNLAALAYFKYTNFLLDVTNQFTGSGFSHADIILPIGISFYTFIQIGYLVDAYGGTVRPHSFVRYVTFASLFPCVTAGPLVLQREIFGQMEDQKSQLFDLSRITVGMTMFTIGLFKKVVFADSIAIYSNSVFDGVANGQGVDAMTAWVGALAYTFQLYFDFSGYSDMALGLGAIFGLMLPLNFNSPFKATNISEFWQRWHMTMTRFFTNYVFSPLAIRGMRVSAALNHGQVRKYMGSGAWPMVFTMLVAGIWHGFRLGVHPVRPAAWRCHCRQQWLAPVQHAETAKTARLGTHHVVVVVGLVIFRSPDVTTAFTMLAAMIGVVHTGSGASVEMIAIAMQDVLPLIAAFTAIVLLLPNSQEITSASWISTTEKPVSISKLARRFAWQPQPAWGAVIAVAFATAFVMIGSNSSFLYYQF